MRLEKLVELGARAEAEQPPQLGLGQMATLVFFRRQCLERASLDFGGAAQKPGEFVGDVKADFHSSIPCIPRRAWERDRVAHVGETGDVGEGALKAEAKAGMRHRAVAPEI